MHQFRPARANILFLCSLIVSVTAGIAQVPPTRYLALPYLSGSRGGDLVASVNSDPSNFNRMMAADFPSLVIADRISADLVHINRESFALEPSLAESWEVGKDARTYTLHLRRGVRFSDGSSFDADDVVFSFRVLADPRSNAIGQPDQVQVDGIFPTVSRVDAYTVRIAFPKPVGMGLRCLDSVPMLPSHKLARAFQEGNIANAWGPAAQPQDIVGLGPFRLREYRRGERVVLERNPHYWKKDKSGQVLPYLDTVTFLIVPDRNAEALRFESGELDVVNLINPENFATLRRNEKERNYSVLDLGPGLQQDFLWFNLNPGKDSSGRPYVDPQKRAFFEKEQFRQAISRAMDREGMVRSILLGLGTPQLGPISSGNKVWYKSNTSTTRLDIARAKDLLSQAGLKDTDGDGVLEFGEPRRPLEIELLTQRGNAVREKAAVVIKDNLSRAGIRVNVQPLLTNELVTRVVESFNYEAILFGFTPTDVAPDLQTDFWFSGGRNHFWHPEQTRPLRAWEAEIDSQISRLVHNLDPAVRRTSFERVQEIWAAQLPAIPTFAAHILTGSSARVGNLRPSILGPHLLWNAEELTKRSDGLNGKQPGARP